MKNIVILSLSLVLVLFFTQNALAIPYMSPQDLYKQSDMVFHGQIISKQAGPGSDFYYQVLVDTYFKNPQNSDSITVAGHKPDSPRTGYPQFEVGDKALFYIHKISGINTLEPYSRKAGIACDAQSFLGSEFLSDKTRSFTAVASNPRITDINGDAVVGKVQRGQPIQITYDEIWNNYPDYKAISLHISVQDVADTKPVFEENRTVFLNACDGPSPIKLNFVPEKNGTYVFSLNIDKKLTTSTNFEVGDSTYSAAIIIPSPLKQFKSGLDPYFVTCKQNLDLVIKINDNSPACVKSTSLERLLRQGWVNAYDNNGKYLPIETPKTIKVQNSDFLLHYSITGGNVKESELDSQSLGLIISLNTTNNGTLTVTIPRALLDTTNDPGSQFIMLADGQQIEFKQIRITISDRTFSIPFQNGTSKLMILGTHY